MGKRGLGHRNSGAFGDLEVIYAFIILYAYYIHAYKLTQRDKMRYLAAAQEVLICATKWHKNSGQPPTMKPNYQSWEVRLRSEWYILECLPKSTFVCASTWKIWHKSQVAGRPQILTDKKTHMITHAFADCIPIKQIDRACLFRGNPELILTEYINHHLTSILTVASCESHQVTSSHQM